LREVNQIVRIRVHLRPSVVKKFIVFLLFASCTLALTSCQETSKQPSVTFFAAASTAPALEAVAQAYSKYTGVEIITVYAASSTLAKQIAEGAPADLFLSANAQWMDYLEARDVILVNSRHTLLNNQLVCIVPADSSLESLDLTRLDSFETALGPLGRIAMGNPGHVPAGIYAKQALQTLELWNALSSRIASMSDVRVAVAMVTRAETPLGIVYATDALNSNKVRVVAKISTNTHSAITYPIALVKGGNPEAGEFLEYVKGPEATAIFKAFGFIDPPSFTDSPKAVKLGSHD